MFRIVDFLRCSRAGDRRRVKRGYPPISGVQGSGRALRELQPGRTDGHFEKSVLPGLRNQWAPLCNMPSSKRRLVRSSSSYSGAFRGHARHRSHIAARRRLRLDRKSTRLNSSHSQISYAVFCLKKKNNNTKSYSGIQIGEFRFKINDKLRSIIELNRSNSSTKSQLHYCLCNKIVV